MILYLDTSSLVKLYVEEAGSSETSLLLESSEIVATSIVAYAEARAAFARRYREQSFSESEFERLKAFFESDWRGYFILHLTLEVTQSAGNLAEKHALRGFDAIHLASAITLSRDISAPVRFSCFDDSLKQAASAENLKTD
mgnify:CR=1 FL=1